MHFIIHIILYITQFPVYSSPGCSVVPKKTKDETHRRDDCWSLAQWTLIQIRYREQSISRTLADSGGSPPEVVHNIRETSVGYRYSYNGGQHFEWTLVIIRKSGRIWNSFRPITQRSSVSEKPSRKIRWKLLRFECADESLEMMVAQTNEHWHPNKTSSIGLWWKKGASIYLKKIPSISILFQNI